MGWERITHLWDEKFSHRKPRIHCIEYWQLKRGFKLRFTTHDSKVEITYTSPNHWTELSEEAWEKDVLAFEEVSTK